jgi:hypothetical protein
VGDPVGLGLVESLRHPGGNVTGIAGLVPEGFIGKELQLLKELVPQASRIAVLIDPTMSAHQLELRYRLPAIYLERSPFNEVQYDRYTTTARGRTSQGQSAA